MPRRASDEHVEPEASIDLTSTGSSRKEGADSQGYWDAIEIVEESESQYFIRWAGKDSQGRPWEPTWEPKENASEHLVAAYTASRTEKRAKQRQPRSKPPARPAAESFASVVPDSQPSIADAPTSAESRPQRSETTPASEIIAIHPLAPIDSPSTDSSDPELESCLDEQDAQAQNDDIRIFNDCSQAPEKPRDDHRRPIGPCPVPDVSAFFSASTIAVSSQFDPIEDSDSSPFRPRIRQRRSHGRLRPAPVVPRPSKTRLELVLGPSQEKENPSPMSSFEAELVASAAASYVSQDLSMTSNSSRPSPARTGSRTRLVKRPISRPVMVSSQIESGSGTILCIQSAVANEALFDDEISDFDDLESLTPGNFNEDYFTSDLLWSQPPVAASPPRNLPDTKTQAGQPEARKEAVDAGEGGGGSTNGDDRGYAYSGYPSHQSQSQQYQHQQQPSHQNSVPGYMGSGPSASSSASYGGAGAYSGGPGGGSGYPYSSHLPSSHAQPSKREYEDDREETAKRARVDQQQQQQQQQEQRQQQQYHYPQQAYPPQPQHYPSHMYSSQPYAYPYGYPSPHGPPEQHHYSPSLAQNYPSSTSYHQQYQQLPPMQTSQPGAQQYARSTTQLPPMQHALSNRSYPSEHPQTVQPPPTVSVDTASPPPAQVPQAATAQAPSAGHLTSPSIARVQNTQSFMTAAPTSESARQSPAPLPTQPAPRTSSPAPTLDGVSDLIALVRASPQIETNDGTKAEIERFLQNPQNYGGESRTHMLDVGERVDFIILYTREGTFKLKRSPTTTIPVEFARSCNHAPDRKRGQTPAVDAVPTLQTSPSASDPVPVASLTRDQLEQQVESLRAQLLTATTELETLRPLVEETANLKTQVQTLTQTNKQLKNSRDSTQQDMAYIQEQYSIASTAASARALEAQVAEAEATRLQGLLDTGLKQKALFYESQVKRWKLEVERANKQVKLVQIERRKMNEVDVRSKAGKWDEVVARRQDKLERKRKLEAGEPVVESESGSEEETVSELLEAADRLRGPPSPPRPVQPSNDSIIRLVMDDSSNSNTSSLTIQEGFKCEWRNTTEGEPLCGELFSTKVELKDHALERHLAL
ncbi:uncharacterized protein JCM15063_000990 [Sporobolomyces koalae]|uniref:uncharacterized protein n=1 Tax=Sporobolomyces koalae TaxID=500713 RepID=UPI0031773D8B